MKKYPNMPYQMIPGWPTSIERRAANEPISFHYHDVEEWLEVESGQMRFTPATDKEEHSVWVSAGEALRLPQGEVHRVLIGPAGVAYKMWTPVEVPENDFAHELDDESLALIEENLKVPDVENTGNMGFFERFLSETFTFRTATGKLLDRNAFLNRSAAPIIRKQSESLRILHKSEDSILLSTIIHTTPKGGGERQSVSNNRLFVREQGVWKCRIWLNYPEPVALP